MILKQNGGIIEWDGEDGDYTPVPHKMIVGADDPIENERVSVKESRTKKVYSGVIIKKGMFVLPGCRLYSKTSKLSVMRNYVGAYCLSPWQTTKDFRMSNKL